LRVGIIPAMPNPILEAADVRKSYGKHAALDGVSLSVEVGERFGLLGPNGAGKTTLLSILAGLLDADGGTVELAGERFTTAHRASRHLVGIGTQDLAVYPDLTARENLLFFGRLYGMTDADLRGRVGELLTAVGLYDRADHRAGTFSGGMKRRLNLAVAVVHRPQVLLLDEPTTGVDPQSRNLIFDMVRSLNAGGMTVVYTSHYMEEVQALCPRIAVIDAGRVLACSTLPDLLRTLDGTLSLTIVKASGLADALAAVRGVKKVLPTEHGFDLTAKSVGPIIADVLEACASVGAKPENVAVAEPTLETVFLHLTGRGLRD
jgi:ABC-2 type transport system ATP-binding protein